MIERHACSLEGKNVRCSCGGQVAVSGTLNPLADLGVGVVNGKLSVKTRYNRNKVVGYTGFCLKCRKQGQFVLATSQV